MALWAALFALFLGIAASGCIAVEKPASAAPAPLPTTAVTEKFSIQTFTVDGTTRCVAVGPWWGGSEAGIAVSCDWKPPAPPSTPPAQRSPYPLEPDKQPGRVVVR
jgi:hypothetical protein